jgi:transglutaminase-like putative cysteine protease
MRKRPGRLLAAWLLAACMLSGCGLNPVRTGQDPTAETTKTAGAAETAEAVEAAPALSPEEEAAAKERQERLEKSRDGFLLDNGYLYAVDPEGELLHDTWVGVLRFEEDGRYTSGSKELDRLVAGVIRKSTDESMSRMEMLHAIYDYTRDNIKYVGFENHENSYKPAHGEGGWMTECATFALENEKGNCYHFAATLAALARGLGYQAFATAGIVGSDEQEHGWVEIVDDDGTVRYCDPETEYARKYWVNEEFDLFWKAEDEIGAETGIAYAQLTDPFAAERKEAEAQGRTLALPTPEA